MMINYFSYEYHKQRALAIKLRIPLDFDERSESRFSGASGKNRPFASRIPDCFCIFSATSSCVDTRRRISLIVYLNISVDVKLRIQSNAKAF